MKYEILGPMNLPSRIPNKNKPVLFKLFLYIFKNTGNHYYILEKGKAIGKNNILVRIDSKCVYAHIFGSARCDCKEQLDASIVKIAKEKNALLVYCYDQDGRGISLRDHLRVYKFQDEGYDTVEANIKAGLKPDARHYKEVIDILKNYKLKSIRLLTNNLARIEEVSKSGIRVKRIPFKAVNLDKYNAAQLVVKQTKLNHLFDFDLENKKVKELFNQSMKQKW